MIPQWVRKYVGTPYQDKGRDGAGTDCWGLVWMIMRDVYDTITPSYENTYATAEGRKEVAETITRNCLNNPDWREIRDGEEQPGDLIILTIGGRPLHCGIVVDDKWMIHTLVGHNAVIERYDTAKWNNRRGGFFRLKQ